jgi:hypothetical protein
MARAERDLIYRWPEQQLETPVIGGVLAAGQGARMIPASKIITRGRRPADGAPCLPGCRGRGNPFDLIFIEQPFHTVGYGSSNSRDT